MSLNIQDLGITEDIRDVINEVSQGFVYFFRESNSKPNPFSHTPSNNVNYLGKSPLISFQDGTELSRKSLLMAEDGIFSFKTGIPEEDILAGDFCLLDFSEGISVKEGVIKKKEIAISTIVTFTLDVTQNVPVPLRPLIPLT